jgi:ketopantoate reductase
MSPQYKGRAQALQQQLEDNHGGITINTINVPSPSTTHGLIRGGVTIHPETAIPAADVVLVSLPSPAHEALVNELAPHLGRGHHKQLLVFLPGAGGLDLMLLQQALAKQPSWQQEQVSYAASKTLPWSCRATGPATVNIRGTKTVVDVALGPQSLHSDRSAHFTAAPLLSSLFEGTTFVVNPNLLEATLMPYNVCGNSILVSRPSTSMLAWIGRDCEALLGNPCFSALDQHASPVLSWVLQANGSRFACAGGTLMCCH